MIFVFVFLGILGGVLVSVVLLIRWLGKFYYKDLWDKTSAYVIMITMAVLTVAGSLIREHTTVNLALFFLITQASYMGLRTYFEKKYAG